MSASFAKQKGPLLVDVIKEKTCRSAIAAIKNGTVDGAMGFDVHLAPLLPDELTPEKLHTVFHATDKPTLALHYNFTYDWHPMQDSDRRRAELFCMAVEAGASCVDMQGYTFSTQDTRSSLIGSHHSFAAASPNEVTVDPETIRQQKDFIDRIHSMGGEVLLSVHTGTFMDCSQTLALFELLEERNPDVIKLVGNCNTDDELAEYFKTLLKAQNMGYHARIHYHCNGARGKWTRIIGPMLGSYLMFCIDRYTESSVFDQLPLRVMTDIYSLLERI